MGLLYDDNFQSYSIGQHPPYTDLQNATIAGAPFIQAGGGYDDPQCLFSPSNEGVVYPILPFISLPDAEAGVTYESLGVPTYQALSASFYLKLFNTADPQGEIFTVNSSPNPYAVTHIAAVRILTDGTIAIVATAGSAFAIPQAISDYALHTNATYWFQINMQFGTGGDGNMTAVMTVAVNGLPIVSSNWNTGFPVSALAVAYWNNVQFSGAGLGVQIGRLTIYDTPQTIPSYAHPGSPVARVNQGVIELIKSQIFGATCPLGAATVGIAYSSSVGLTNGTAPFTYALASGSLPPGLSLNTSTGAVTGIPTGVGFFPYSITITDSSMPPLTATISCSILVAAPPFPPPFCIVPLTPTIQSTSVAYTEPTELEGS